MAKKRKESKKKKSKAKKTAARKSKPAGKKLGRKKARRPKPAPKKPSKKNSFKKKAKKTTLKKKPKGMSSKKKPSKSPQKVTKGRLRIKKNLRPIRKPGPKKKMKEVQLVRAGEVETLKRRRSVKAIRKVQWRSFERELVEMRKTIVQAVRTQAETTSQVTGAGDEADIASQNIEREIQFELSDNERKMLEQIDAALRRIEKGVYGICENCNNPIDQNRIKALPFVRYCISCQSTHETAVLIL